MDNKLRYLLIVLVLFFAIKTPSTFEHDQTHVAEGISRNETQALLIYESAIDYDKIGIETLSIIEGFYKQNHVLLTYINNPKINSDEIQSASVKLGDQLLMQDNYIFKEENNFYVLSILANKQEINSKSKIVLHGKEDEELTLELSENIFTDDNLGKELNYPTARETEEGVVLYQDNKTRFILNKDVLIKRLINNP